MHTCPWKGVLSHAKDVLNVLISGAKLTAIDLSEIDEVGTYTCDGLDQIFGLLKVAFLFDQLGHIQQFKDKPFKLSLIIQIRVNAHPQITPIDQLDDFDPF